MATVGGLWFNPRNLGNYVTDSVLERGLTLYRDQKVLDLQIRAIDNGRWQLTGSVQGSERSPYSQNIRLHINVHGMLTHWDADCTCPVGMDCKHAVALSLKAAYRTQATANAAPPKPPTDTELAAARLAAEQRTRDAATLKVRQWLAQFDALDRRGSAQPDSAQAENFVYTLCPGTTQQKTQLLQLQLQKTYLKKNGEWAKPKNIQAPPYPGQPLFDAASPAEQELLRLLKGLASGSANYAYAATPAAARATPSMPPASFIAKFGRSVFACLANSKICCVAFPITARSAISIDNSGSLSATNASSVLAASTTP